MVETKRLRLDKGRASDWADMYRHVWSRPESAKYMLWDVTTNEADARSRMERTIAFQKNHDTYLVYEKASGQAIGFAGVESVEPGVCQEAGICLGPDFVRKGYGREILHGLMRHAVEQYGAEVFLYTSRAENAASRALAEGAGFVPVREETRIDPRDGCDYVQIIYRRDLRSCETGQEGEISPGLL